MKKLDKFYDTFSSDERLKLALAAQIRGDQQELKRLWNTCPQKIYSLPEAEFDEKMEGILLLAKSVLTQLLLTEKDLQIIMISTKWYIRYITATVENYARGANNAWKRLGQRGKIPFDVDGREPTDEELESIGLAAALEELPGPLIRQREEIIAELKGYMAAFKSFVQKLG